MTFSIVSQEQVTESDVEAERGFCVGWHDAAMLTHES